MCKTTPIKFSALVSTKIPALMRNFPQCGVRFLTEGDYGLVAVHPDIRDQLLVKNKIAAAKIKAKSQVFVVNLPRQVVDIFKVEYIPTLTDRVA